MFDADPGVIIRHPLIAACVKGQVIAATRDYLICKCFHIKAMPYIRALRKFRDTTALLAAWMAIMLTAGDFQERLRHAVRISRDRLEEEQGRVLHAWCEREIKGREYSPADWIDLRLEMESARLRDLNSKIFRWLAANGLKIERSSIGFAEIKIIEAAKLYELGLKALREDPGILI